MATSDVMIPFKVQINKTSVVLTKEQTMIYRTLRRKRQITEPLLSMIDHGRFHFSILTIPPS
jgi:hypothetical protein